MKPRHTTRPAVFGLFAAFVIILGLLVVTGAKPPSTSALDSKTPSAPLRMTSWGLECAAL